MGWQKHPTAAYRDMSGGQCMLWWLCSLQERPSSREAQLWTALVTLVLNVLTRKLLCWCHSWVSKVTCRLVRLRNLFYSRTSKLSKSTYSRLTLTQANLQGLQKTHAIPVLQSVGTLIIAQVLGRLLNSKGKSPSAESRAVRSCCRGCREPEQLHVIAKDLEQGREDIYTQRTVSLVCLA